MNARDIMTACAECVPPEMLVEQAYALMRRLSVRHLPVTAHGQLYGILSDRDLLLRASREGEGELRFPRISVGEATSFHPITCPASASVPRLDGQLYGILSDRDLLLRASREGEGELRFPRISVGEATSFHPITCPASASVPRLARLMVDNKVDSIPITNVRGELEGIVTSTDLLLLLCEPEDEPRYQATPRA